jgi:AraC-like DNA-binding protein
MPNTHLTGLARLPLLILRRAEELGLDRDALLRRSRLEEQELNDPDARVSMDKIWGLWSALVDSVDDPALGVRLVESIDVRDLGLVGYMMACSPTLRQALRCLVRYGRVLTDTFRLELLEDAQPPRLVHAIVPTATALRHPVDSRLGSVVAVARQITRTDLVPLEVRFSYEQPSDTAELQRYLRSALSFGRDEDAVLFRDQDLDLPVEGADETLGQYLNRLAEATLDELGGEQSFLDRVREVVWTELSRGAPSVRRAAELLSVSTRTLQRRLGEAGTSFTALVDELRRQMAVRLLRNRDLAIYEVAFLLGYSEPSTFYRAFRRWYDVAPQEYRLSRS